MKRWGFCGGAYVDGVSNVNAEACENWIPEYTVGGNAKSKLVLKARPGLAAFATAGVGPHRAAIEENGSAFVVSGTGVYEIDALGTATLLGSVAANGAEAATIHSNGTQLFIVSGGLGYTLTLATETLAQVTDADFPSDVVMGFYLNGHFGVIKRNSRTFAVSAAFDGTAWSALDISEKSKTTDNLIAAVVDQDASELWLIGSQRSEVWWYSGAANFPLEPVPNLIVPTGGRSGFSWIPVGGSVYGLGQSVDGGTVAVRFQAGYTPERFSTHAIDAALQGYPAADLEMARAFSLEWQGHRFYVLTVPNQATWAYDEATHLWSNWTYLNTTDGSREPYLGFSHMFAFGKHLIGSRADGAVYEWSDTTYSDAGREMRLVRRAPYLGDGPHRLVHRRLWFDLQVGVGLTTGQGSAPVGMVRYSDDQAKTWSVERTVSLGAIGAYSTIAELWALGLAGPGGRVYELVITDPVVRAIVDADVELQREVAA